MHSTVDGGRKAAGSFRTRTGEKSTIYGCCVGSGVGRSAWKVCRTRVGGGRRREVGQESEDGSPGESGGEAPQRKGELLNGREPSPLTQLLGARPQFNTPRVVRHGPAVLTWPSTMKRPLPVSKPTLAPYELLGGGDSEDSHCLDRPPQRQLPSDRKWVPGQSSFYHRGRNPWLPVIEFTNFPLSLL